MTESNTAHSNLLTKAARSILRPLGLTQVGRSRRWTDDNGWWLCIVEFQPSSWSRGSYLNVGCNWLWCAKDYRSFDEGYRVEGYTEFKDAAQFEAVSMSLAKRAAMEVIDCRERFASPGRVADYYIALGPLRFWQAYHAAMACGIAGRSDAANRFFAQVIDTPDDRDWAIAAKLEAEQLRSMAFDTQRFREAALDAVKRARALLKLQARDAITF